MTKFENKMNYLFVLFTYNLYGWKITHSYNTILKIDRGIVNKMWYKKLYWSQIEKRTWYAPLP